MINKYMINKYMILMPTVGYTKLYYINYIIHIRLSNFNINFIRLY